ncbi:MAG: VacJ family lipoprotein [Proteobacteria bacterium]|nr:VacJ family lipoprotein [Pseudomonadota bacterium]
MFALAARVEKPYSERTTRSAGDGNGPSNRKNMKTAGAWKGSALRCGRRALGFLVFMAACVLAPVVDGAAQEQVHDPIEKVNRGIFWFNDKTDAYLIEPIAKGYNYVTPDPVQRSITNFFHNLRYPRYLVSDLVRLEFTDALEHTGRFLVNSTVGLLGLFDVATDWGLPENEQDFGLALAHHGVGPGAYLVLPILGPSNLRDTLGTAVDFFLDPFVIFSFTNVRAGIKDPITLGAYGLKLVNTRAGLIEAIDTARASSVDYYLFMQGAYYQHRWGLLWKGTPPETDAFGGADDDIFPPPGGNVSPAK